MTLLLDNREAEREVVSVLKSNWRGRRPQFVSTVDISHQVQTNTGKLIPYALLVRVMSTLSDNHQVALSLDGWRLTDARK